MSRQYLLPCSCGKLARVQASQAGQSLRCKCGRTLAVPTLRQLRQLPPTPDAEGDAAPKAASAKWSQLQGGTFVGGLVLSVIALGFFGYLLSQRLRQPEPASPFDRFLQQEDLTDMPAADAWAAWQAYRTYGLGWDHSQQYVQAQQQARTLNIGMAIAAGTALLGVSLTLLATFYLKPARQPRAL